MASESPEEETVTVRLPADLDEWLDEHASTLGVDRETLLVQVLASYRTTAELDGEVDADDLGVDIVDPDTVARTVEAYLDERLEDHVESHLDGAVEAGVQSVLAEQLDERIDAAVEERLAEATEAVQAQTGERVERLEDEFMEKLEDVRERVIQVKQEADAKAAGDHDHEEFERLVSLDRGLDEVESEVEALADRLEAAIPEQETAIEDIEERVDTVQDRLQTVAWVVSDLREAQEGGGGMEAVDRIKRAAAKADVDRANCENCGEGVTIGLLTDPNCPHCDATVTDVEPAASFFSKPRLLVASQLESGEES
jgi:hypothetical protein